MLDAIIHRAYVIKGKQEYEPDKRTMHRIILALIQLQNIMGLAVDASVELEEINEMEAGKHD